MSKTPVTITQNDSVMLAAESFREHGFKYLPVVADHRSRRIVGFLRVRKLMARVMERLGAVSS